MKTSYRVALARVVLLATASGMIGGLAACGSASEGEDTSVTALSLAGPLAISGTIVDARGNGLPGVTVRLAGAGQATVVTSATGTYAFNNIGAASYSVQATLNGCTFAPNVVNLNGLIASTVVNFDGSGPSCGGAAQNSGATSGAFTISGRVANAAGNPVRGVRVALNGAAQGVRTTADTGTFSFQVNSGSYSLQPSGSCTLTPNVVNLSGVTGNRVQNFVAGAGCTAVVGGSGGAGGGGGAASGGAASGGAATGGGGAGGAASAGGGSGGETGPK